MKSDTTVTLDWFRVNVTTLVLLASAVWWMSDQNATTLARINAIETSRVERIKVADVRFAELNLSMAQLSQKVAPLDNITYRVGVVEGQINETGKRIDRLSELILNSLDLIRRDVNGLSTKVEVLSQKIDSMSGDDKRRASLPASPIR